MNINFMIRKLINCAIPKYKNRIYAFPHNNGKNDKYDLMNYSSDNLLCVLNYINDNNMSGNCTFYVECYSKGRLEQLQNLIRHWNSDVRLILSEQAVENKKEATKIKWKNRFIRYSCKTWISCTPHAGYEDKLKNQCFLCVSYSTPLKSAIANRTEWNLSHIDFFFETSLLTASVHSSQYRNHLTSCPILGFPRNDTLFAHKRRDEIDLWLKRKGFSLENDKVIVYAPTYREYEGAYDGKCILGYDVSNAELEKFLEENNYLLIVKFHPLQKIEEIGEFTRIIKYESNYNFSLYDLLSESSLLISDYSSIIHDYIITGKPIVIDCFDYSQYDRTRGFAFDPIDFVLPGEICRTFSELRSLLEIELNRNNRTEKYYLVQKMFHKYVDQNSTKRVANFIMGEINGFEQ